MVEDFFWLIMIYLLILAAFLARCDAMLYEYIWPLETTRLALLMAYYLID